MARRQSASRLLAKITPGGGSDSPHTREVANVAQFTARAAGRGSSGREGGSCTAAENIQDMAARFGDFSERFVAFFGVL